MVVGVYMSLVITLIEFLKIIIESPPKSCQECNIICVGCNLGGCKLQCSFYDTKTIWCPVAEDMIQPSNERLCTDLDLYKRLMEKL